jgi:hypothetical protein
MSSITFVTAFFNIYNHPVNSEIIENRFARFNEIAITGIQICLYTEDEFYDRCEELAILFPNIKLMHIVVLKNSNVAKVCSDVPYTLPDKRCKQKDNSDFMIFINSKYELIENAILENPWNSTHFAWIDFSITYIFKNLSESQSYLSCLSKRTLAPSFVAIGGWGTEKTSFTSLIESFNDVNWRFCGGFLIGDKTSMTEFIELSKRYYPIFMNTYKKLTWEVNFWSFLETYVCWKPIWYHAMFDDSIIKIPSYLYCKKFDYIKIENHLYKVIDGFVPSSASHIYYKGQHLLNTRYINYLLNENGYYYFCDPNKHIITKNVVSTLENETFFPESHILMDDNSVKLAPTIYPEGSHCEIYGFEDIRLYEYKNEIRFVATNRNFAPIGKNRMVVGNYNLETSHYENCRLIDSPNNYQYEKNWIPIVVDSNEYFIYKWFPMEIYKINYEKNSLTHVYTYKNTLTAPDFYRVRGSSTFIEIDNMLVGVLHFSDEGKPRKYYHMLVSLDKESLCPLKYSEVFCFQHIGVEFCIGFWKHCDEYIFWVSKMDRNPSMIRIPIINIPLCFEFST